MTDITRTTPIALPEARVPITIRAGTMEDVPFMDSLQKKTTKQVGWMPTKQFEGKIAAGHVLVACANRDEETKRRRDEVKDGSAHFVSSSLGLSVSSPVGYLIGNDQYFKRDDVGIIYQINVIPEMRRSLVAASLLKAQFERSAYGCRLYCCWCAQDIEANRFWESMGFVPLAYRAGSLLRGKCGATSDESGSSSHRSSLSTHRSARVHIFWQKRIRKDDTTTAWWFPSQTSGGSIRADRIVLPIPPGTHWSDAKPLILPGDSEQKELNHEGTKGTKGDTKRKTRKKNDFVDSSCPSRPRGETKPLGGLRFAQPEPLVSVGKPKREKKSKAKHDPRLLSAARELKDRYLEQINDGSIVAAAKYEVSRCIETSARGPMLLAA